MADAPLQQPTPLTLDHDCSTFDCGSEPLNSYLRRFAWTNQQAGAARTYVTARDDRVVGYYTLVYGILSQAFTGSTSAWIAQFLDINIHTNTDRRVGAGLIHRAR